MRREVHAAFAIPGFYQDSTMLAGVYLDIRWHDKLIPPLGALNELTARYDYVGVLENIDKLIFNVEELAAKNIVLRRKGSVLFSGYDDSIFILDVQEPNDGPIKVTWNVTRHSVGIVVGPSQVQSQVGRWRFFEDTDGGLKIRAPDGSVIPLVNSDAVGPSPPMGRWGFFEDTDGGLKIRAPDGSVVPLVSGG
jgi:hypothetical protein